MGKLPYVAVILGALWATPAQSMPVVALAPLEPGLAILVGGGCGIGVHRGPFDGCAIYGVYNAYDDWYDRAYRRGYHRGFRHGYYRGYRDGYYDRYPYARFYGNGGVIVVDKYCGFGSYLSCSHGLCWRHCY